MGKKIYPFFKAPFAPVHPMGGKIAPIIPPSYVPLRRCIKWKPKGDIPELTQRRLEGYYPI